MRVVLITAVFPPEPEPAAVMADELTRRWARDGHEVVVVCPSPNRPTGERYVGYPGKLSSEATSGGRTVVRVWTWLIGRKRKVVNRVLENVTFGLMAAAALLRMPKADVVIVESWPILSYLPIMAVLGGGNVSFVNYIQDVYPEAIASGGQIDADSLAARALLRLDRLICAKAAKNVVIGPNMRTLLSEARGLPPDHFVVIENWIDVAAIGPVTASGWRAEVGLRSDEFVAMFAGTMGHASGVDVLLEVAELVAAHDDVRIVCVGDGVLRATMASEAATRGLQRLTLLPFQPRERLAEVQSAPDVAILTTHPSASGYSVPSKLITYLAAGRPVICAASASSDVARLVASEGVGVVVPPGNARALADAILGLRAMPTHDLRELGRRARSLAESRFSIESAAARFTALFDDLRREGSGSAA